MDQAKCQLITQGEVRSLKTDGIVACHYADTENRPVKEGDVRGDGQPPIPGQKIALIRELAAELFGMVTVRLIL